MMFVSLDLPPGLYRNGTDYQARGRWWDAQLVRWFNGEMRPMGGWRTHSVSNFAGVARTLLAWRDNNNSTWAALGTASKLYAMSRSGAINDITPVGLVAGQVSATSGGGYGSGAYGAGTYGSPRGDVSTIEDATVWSLDTWGPYLVVVSPDDQKLYQWNLNPAEPAAPIANAPTAKALVVSNEHFLFALGVGGDERTVAWPDQSDNTLWAPDATNSAGSYTLPSTGRILCGKRLPQGTGIWTDSELWIAQYVGGVLLYGFQKADSGCGALSRNCVVTAASQAFWMGPNGFFAFNGFVRPLPCAVQDYVYSNLDTEQVSKITAMRLSAFREIWWFYPSLSSSGGASSPGECDSYVAYNYQEDTWTTGAQGRSCGADQDVFAYPLMGGTDGVVYDHELGFDYGGATPYAESGPYELPGSLAGGAQLFTATQLIADEKSRGDTSASFYSALYPNTTETLSGPYSLGSRPTDVRFTGRQVRLKVTGAEADDWRWGAPRLIVQPAGRR